MSLNCTLLFAESDREKSVEPLCPTFGSMPRRGSALNLGRHQSDRCSSRRSRTSTFGEEVENKTPSVSECLPPVLLPSFKRAKGHLLRACCYLTLFKWHLSPFKSWEKDVLSHTRKSLHFINSVNRARGIPMNQTSELDRSV